MDFLAARKALLAKPERIQWPIFFLGLAVTLLLTVLVFCKPAFFHFQDFKIYDTYLRSYQAGRVHENVPRPVLVDIDEQSLARYGQWPWPRYRLARLLDTLTGMHPASIGVDIIFPEPDRTSLQNVQQSMRAELGEDIEVRAGSERFLDNDAIFAAVLEQAPAVLAYAFHFNRMPGASAGCPPTPLVIENATGAESSGSMNRLYQPDGVVCSLPVLVEKAGAAGFINMAADDDGVIRRMPLVMRYQGGLYPSLALRTLMRARGLEKVGLVTSGDRLEKVTAGDVSIPVDEQGNVLVRMQPDIPPFERISAQDVIEGKVARQSIAGRILLVGTTALGLDSYHTTPLGTLVPGVACHAQLIDNIQNSQFFFVPSWQRWLEAALVVLFGIAAAFLVSWAQSLTSFLLLVITAIAVWYGVAWMTIAPGIVVSPVLPLITLASNFTLCTFFKYRKEERILRQRNQDLVVMQNFTIQCLAALAETRDSETGRHILRCQHYVKLLAEGLAQLPKYAPILTDETIDLLCKSAPLHDIGKIGIPDRVLLKPGRLTSYEFEEMKRHTTYGQEAIERAEQYYGAAVKESFLRLGKEMAYSHHERWDGSGYPEGLCEEAIPLSGRIMAIADVYDALICKRRYKPPFSHEEAIGLIQQGKGTHFDPQVVEVFMRRHQRFRRIASAFPDEGGGGAVEFLDERDL